MQDQKPNLPEEAGVLKKSITSGKWLALGYALQKGIGFVSFLILARLLSPAEFGLMALVLLVPKFVETTTDTGFATAVIQRAGDVRHYLNPIWTIGVLKALLIALLTFIFGPLIARFLHAETATLAIKLGGLFIVIINLSNIGETYLLRELNFKNIVIRNILKDVAYVLIAVTTALFFSRSYWALFVGTMAAYATQTISTYFLHPYRPRLSSEFSRLKDLIHYSKWIMGQSWLGQLYGFMETAIVARLTSIAAVGLYGKAKGMAAVAPGFLGPMIRMISFPAYTQIQTNKEKLKDGWRKSLQVIFFFLVPVTILILFAGGKIILILLGQNWLGMTNALRVLLVFFFLGTVNDVAQPLFNAIGQPDKQVKFDLVKIILTLSLIIPLTLNFGIVGTAVALLLGVIPVVILNLHYLVRLTDGRYRDILHTILVPLLISLVLLLPATLYKQPILNLATPALIALLALAGLLYLILIYLVGASWNQGPYKTLRVILSHVK